MRWSQRVSLRLLGLVALYCCVIDAKVFEQCELARLLKDKHRLPLEEVANWVCIAKHQSNLNSDLRTGGPASGSHGLFQISDEFWCSKPGKDGACDIPCDRLRNDDLADDLECIARIYDEHQRISGDGYTAWTTYARFCKGHARKSIEGCFESSSPKRALNYFDRFDNSIVSVQAKKKSKVYTPCELAKELRYKHQIPLDQIDTWVCIAKHESNFNTSAIGRLNADGSGDHGLFQISDIYWCSPPGKGWACGLSCDELEDSDISDDVECIKRIYEEHTRISGDGFNAWAVYQPYCKSRTRSYTEDCFSDGDGFVTDVSTSSFDFPTLTPSWNLDTKPKKPGKVYTPCELAKELRNKHNIPLEQIATWVCIAKHESNFNTSAIGRLNSDGSGDHGLFQISDIYWCSPPGNGWACGLSCDELEDSDISNDVDCIRKIYEEHERLSGDGFNAWTVYKPHCKGRSERFVEGCFSDFETNTISTQSYVPDRGSHRSPSKPKIGRGKVYSACELAKELRYKHHLPLAQIDTWVCIAKHESNFNTSAIGRLNADGSGDHGLFQISDIYWCSPPGKGWACGLSCDDLEDSDITDDVECMKKIHEEHTRLSGDGFNAWAVYKPYCKDRTKSYIGGCFDDYSGTETNALIPEVETRYKFQGPSKSYTRCELAEELRYKHKMPESQIATWVCIAEHESNLNTGAMNAGSGDHGLFQISELFWCDTTRPGKECRVECAKFRDNDITDDVECIQKIYKEHTRLSGDGFNAWVVYPQRCKGRAEEYIKGCSQSSTQPPKVTERPPFIVPAITAPTNLLDYSEQFSKRLGSTRTPFSSVRFSDFFKKSSLDNSNQFFESPTTKKGSLYSFKFGEFFDNSKLFGGSQDTVLPTSSSQTFDDKFFSSNKPFDAITPKTQQFGFPSVNVQSEGTSRLGTGAGSRFSLSSFGASSPESTTTTRKPFVSIFDDSKTSTDSVFNFGERPIRFTIKDKVTTKPPIKGTTSREDRFAGFSSQFSTTKLSVTVSPTKSVFSAAPVSFGSKGALSQQAGKFETTARAAKQEPSQIFVPTSTTDPDIDIFGFYFDLYNLKRKPASTTTFRSSAAVVPASTKAPLLLQNPGTAQTTKLSAFRTSTTSTVRPFASSGFSATPEFRGVRFGSFYDSDQGQSARITSNVRSSSANESRPSLQTSKKAANLEQGRGSELRLFTEIGTTTTSRPSRFRDTTTQAPFTIKGRLLTGFRFGSAIDSESGSLGDVSPRKPFAFDRNNYRRAEDKQTDGSSSRSSLSTFDSFRNSATQPPKTTTTRKPFGVVRFGLSSTTEATTRGSSGFSSTFDESFVKLGTTTSRSGNIFDEIFDRFVH